MKQFLGVLRYEFNMSFKRRSILITALLFSAYYIYLWLTNEYSFDIAEGFVNPLFAQAGRNVFGLNLFFPVVVGIAASDRALRDFQLGTRELLRATHLRKTTYVLGKYCGVVASFIALEFIIVFLVSTLIVFIYHVPAIIILYHFLCVLFISAPGLCFIIAFSLFFPLFMPLRVYQILFTGYWYWGNFISPTVMFTLSDTVLNASGEFPMTAFLGVMVSVDSPLVTQAKAITNIAVLLLTAALVLAAMTTYINKTERRAA
ncbi:MAG: hypothetical protein PWQ55_2830 [Chloroflexota bacterium]|nr:hypothetical protein [Chloroflexota bacterium]